MLSLRKWSIGRLYYPMDMSGDEIKEDMLEHAEKEYDEHVWLSLKNAETLCNAITDALEEIDPANKDAYAANAASYLEKLAALDGEYQTVVDNAARKTVLFGDRSRSAIWWTITV